MQPHKKTSLFSSSSLKTGITALSVALLAACGGSDNSSTTTTTTNTGIVSVLVNQDIAVVTGTALAFQLSSNVAFANNSGYARLDGLPVSDRLIFNVGRQDHGLQTFVTSLKEGESRNFIPVDLLKLTPAENTVTKTKTGKFKLADGGTFTQDKIQVVIPKDAVIRNDRADITTDLQLFITPINVTDITKKYLPADWKSSTTSNNITSITPLEVVSAVHVQIEEVVANNNVNSSVFRLGLNDLTSFVEKQGMSIRLPVTTDNPSATADLYYFDVNDAYWKKDTQLTLSADKKSYTGSTSRTGYLAIMKPVTNTVTVSGCVERKQADGKVKAIDRATVQMRGTSYAGYDQTLTDSKGKFTLTAKRGSKISLSLQAGQTRLENLTTDTLTANTTLNNGTCYQLDALDNGQASKGKLTWSGGNDYDINVVLPDNTLMFYNRRSIVDSAVSNSIAVEIIENAGNSSEDLNYSSYMLGDHLIYVNNYTNNFKPSMTAANTQFTLNGNTVKPPAGEVTEKDSKLVDRRTSVWLAAILRVTEKSVTDGKLSCDVQVITNPSKESVTGIKNITTASGVASVEEVTATYQSWLTDKQFASFKLFKDTDLLLTNVIKSDTPKYCNTVTFK